MPQEDYSAAAEPSEEILWVVLQRVTMRRYYGEATDARLATTVRPGRDVWVTGLSVSGAARHSRDVAPRDSGRCRGLRTRRREERRGAWATSVAGERDT